MAKIGTPENPEILDPQGPGESFNEDPRKSAPQSRPEIGWRARLKLVRQMMTALIGAVFPALLLDLVLISLAEAAWAGSTLAGLGAIILFVPSMVLSLIAFIALLIFLPLILATLFGRRLASMNRFGAFDPHNGGFNASGFGGPFGFRGGSAGPFQVRVFKFGNFGGGNRGEDFGRFKTDEPRDVTRSSPLEAMNPRLRGDSEN